MDLRETYVNVAHISINVFPGYTQGCQYSSELYRNICIRPLKYAIVNDVSKTVYKN